VKKILGCALGLIFVSALYVSGDEISDFLEGPPYPGGLPVCKDLLAGCAAQRDLLQAELDVFEGEVNACQETIDQLESSIETLQTALSDCEANSHGIPGDGETGPAKNYSDTGNTVLDNVSGLEWVKKTNDGSIHDRDNGYTYLEAVQWVADLNSSGFEGGGWELPDRIKAMSITQYHTGHPCIDAVFGPATLSVATYYWTSSPNPVNSGQAYIQDYRTCLSTTQSKSNTARVIAVR